MPSTSNELAANLRESNAWIEDVTASTRLDQDGAIAALRAVLHAIRDETTIRQSAHFVAPMPAFVRGLYFEDWDPSRPPVIDHDAQRFLERLRTYFPNSARDFDLQAIVRGVFAVLERRIPDAAAKVKHMLPRELQSLWSPTIAEETEERRERIITEERISTYEALRAERGTERDAPLAPHQNRTPGEQHRGGPLPNQMK
jgi:uncharacterized protein (DUF2267 family)